MPKLKEIALDIVKFGRTHDEEATRFLKSNEQRLNENFRRLKEATEEIMADFSDYYPKSEVDTLLSAKADVITSYGDLSKTGERQYPTPSAVSVPDSTYTDVASVTLGAGVWVLIAKIRFAKNGTGYRYQRLSTTAGSSGSNFSLAMNDTVVAFADDIVYTQGVDLVVATTEKTYYLKAWQNSGSALSCTGRIVPIRIC